MANNTKYNLPKTPAEAAALISQCKFEPFDAQDWEIFKGCESPNPMVCYVDGNFESGLAVVQDGSTFHFEAQDEEGIVIFAQFSLAKGSVSLV